MKESFVGTANAHHRLYVESVFAEESERITQELLEAQVACLEAVATRLGQQRFDRPAHVSFRHSPLTFAEVEQFKLTGRLKQQQNLTGMTSVRRMVQEQQDTTHFQEHKADYYDLAVFLATAAGKEIFVGGVQQETSQERIDELTNNQTDLLLFEYLHPASL